MINNSSLDNTILKLFLSQIEEGDINQIKKFIINYNINIKTLINPENNQNPAVQASGHKKPPHPHSAKHTSRLAIYNSYQRTCTDNHSLVSTRNYLPRQV